MHSLIRRGSTRVIQHIFVKDASHTDGRGLTGLAAASSGLAAAYIKTGDTAATQLTLEPIANLGKFQATSGHLPFAEIDATLLPGWYEIHLPDEVLATDGELSLEVELQGATDMEPVHLEIEFEDAAPIRPLRFDEPADRPYGATMWPVTVGIPFSNGEQLSPEGLALCDAEGRPLPAQFSHALDWRMGEKTMSWAHCDFLAPIGGGEGPSAIVHSDIANPAPAQAVNVEETSTTITIDTGALTFTVSKTDFNLFDSLSAGGNDLIASSSLYWKDTDGNLYEGKYVVDSVTVESSGPMKAVIRAEGWYQTAGGSRKLRYQVWIAAFAGLECVRIYDRLVWTENLNLYAVPTSGSDIWTTKSVANSSVTIEHGWSTGDPVKIPYSTSSSGPTSSTSGTLPGVSSGAALNHSDTYFLNKVSNTTFKLHRTLSDALAGTNSISVTAAGSDRHTVQAQRPVLAEYGLLFNLSDTATTARVGIEGDDTPASFAVSGTGSVTSVTAYQSEHDTATLTPGVGSPSSTTRLSGWADVQLSYGAGLAVALKGLANQVPKVLYADSSKIVVKLWGGEDMSLREEDRVLPAHYSLGYTKEWLPFNGEANPIGLAKTHEVWLWPTATAAENTLRNDLVQRPVACCADPWSACSTDYLEGIRPSSATPAQYADVELMLENLLRYATNRDITQGDFDEWNFGDLRLFRNGPFRTWDNGGYNCSDLFWIQFYRTGKRFFLEEGIHNSRHVMDVDTVAHSQIVSGADTYTKIKGRGHAYATLQWAWVSPYVAAFTDHPRHLLLNWLMTGYEVAAEVLQIQADNRKASGYPTPTPGGDVSTTSREQYGAIEPTTVHYEFTGDPGFYHSARAWAQLAIDAQNTGTELTSTSSYLFINNKFRGFFYEGLQYLLRKGNETDIAFALGAVIGDFGVAPSDPVAAPDWGCTNPPTRQGRAVEDMVTFAVVAKHFDAPEVLAFPMDRIVRQARTVQRTGDYLGFDSIDGIATPTFIRGAIAVLGAWADAGRPDFNWPGNSAFFGSQVIGQSPWASQLTLYVNKDSGVEQNLRLVFKDTNLTSLEAFGRLQAIVLDPADTATTIDLGTTTTFGVTFSGSTASTSTSHGMINGKPIRFSTGGTLPSPLSTSTTYYARYISDTSFSVHTSYSNAVAGSGATSFSGGSGSHSLVRPDTIADYTLTFSSSDAAGVYRIYIQGEAQLFYCAPKGDMSGLVVELPATNDLVFESPLDPSEFYCKLASGQATLALSEPTSGHDISVLPVTVSDANYERIEAFLYDGGSTTSQNISIPSGARSDVLVLSKGIEEYSPTALNSLPTLRLGNCDRHMATSASQFFLPLASIASKTDAFWRMEETSAGSNRYDATSGARHLVEQHGPGASSSDHIGSNGGGRVGTAAQFAAAKDLYLSVTDSLFKMDGSFTIWGWVRIDGYMNNRYLFVKGSDFIASASGSEWAIYGDSTGVLHFWVNRTSGGPFDPSGGPSLPVDGVLRFVVGWYDASAGTINLQVDNGTVWSQTISGTIVTGTAPFCVGGTGTNGRGWQGLVDAVGFAKTVLSAHELTLLYNGGAGLEYPF